MDRRTLDFLEDVRRVMGEADVDSELRKATNVAAMGDHLKKLGLHVSFGKATIISGETYQSRDILKKFGFTWDKGGKTWRHKSMDLDFEDLYNQLIKASPAAKQTMSSSGVPLDMSQMAPDTRKTHHDRSQQVSIVAKALEIAKKPPSKENDGEMHLVNQEVVYGSIFDATDNEIVWRAVAAAKKFSGWGADTIIGAAKDREELNRKRAANAKKYGA